MTGCQPSAHSVLPVLMPAGHTVAGCIPHGHGVCQPELTGGSWVALVPGATLCWTSLVHLCSTDLSRDQVPLNVLNLQTVAWIMVCCLSAICSLADYTVLGTTHLGIWLPPFLLMSTLFLFWLEPVYAVLCSSVSWQFLRTRIDWRVSEETFFVSGHFEPVIEPTHADAPDTQLV